MMPFRLYLTLLMIILIEGYVVLAYELIAIRLSVPFVGSGTDTIAIIIASVLMPLAFGYQAGGRFKGHPLKSADKSARPYKSVREKLAHNLRVSGLILLFGISYLPVSFFFESLSESIPQNRIILTAIYCLVFMVYPVFLLGQTIPLISHFFSKQNLPRVTGTILFVSTFGSFLGAVFSTVVLMSLIGVHYTAMICIALLSFILIVVGGKNKSRNVQTALFMLFAGIAMNSPQVMQHLNIIAFNQYNIIRVFEDPQDGTRYLSLNGNNSSKITRDGRVHDYAEFIERHYINHSLWKDDKPPMNILVIGAGGFTIGKDDRKNNYTFIDIDKDLKTISEDLLLQRKLHDNVTFEPIPARAFLTQTKEKYDLIILDAYLGHATLPEHLVTRDFFRQVRGKMAHEGALIMNFITSYRFSSDFSRHLDHTLRSVFPYLSRQMIGFYDGFNIDHDITNVLYIYHHNENETDEPVIYTDMKNRVFWDTSAKQKFKSAAPQTPAEQPMPQDQKTEH